MDLIENKENIDPEPFELDSDLETGVATAAQAQNGSTPWGAFDTDLFGEPGPEYPSEIMQTGDQFQPPEEEPFQFSEDFDFDAFLRDTEDSVGFTGFHDTLGPGKAAQDEGDVNVSPTADRTGPIETVPSQHVDDQSTAMGSIVDNFDAPDAEPSTFAELPPAPFAGRASPPVDAAGPPQSNDHPNTHTIMGSNGNFITVGDDEDFNRPTIRYPRETLSGVGSGAAAGTTGKNPIIIPTTPRRSGHERGASLNEVRGSRVEKRTPGRRGRGGSFGATSSPQRPMPARPTGDRSTSDLTVSLQAPTSLHERSMSAGQPPSITQRRNPPRYGLQGHIGLSQTLERGFAGSAGLPYRGGRNVQAGTPDLRGSEYTQASPLRQQATTARFTQPGTQQGGSNSQQSQGFHMGYQGVRNIGQSMSRFPSMGVDHQTSQPIQQTGFFPQQPVAGTQQGPQSQGLTATPQAAQPTEEDHSLVLRALSYDLEDHQNSHLINFLQFIIQTHRQLAQDLWNELLVARDMVFQLQWFRTQLHDANYPIPRPWSQWLSEGPSNASSGRVTIMMIEDQRIDPEGKIIRTKKQLDEAQVVINKLLTERLTTPEESVQYMDATQGLQRANYHLMTRMTAVRWRNGFRFLLVRNMRRIFEEMQAQQG